MIRGRVRAVHHLDLWVDDVARAADEWGWLLGELDWEVGEPTPGSHCWTHPDGTYLFMEHSPDQHGGHDRLRPGVNHLALTVDNRDLLDRIRSASSAHGWHELFADHYPHAGGDDHTALYLTNSEEFEVEIVLATH